MFDAGGILAENQGREVLDGSYDAARLPFERGLAPAVEAVLIGLQFHEDPVAHLRVNDNWRPVTLICFGSEARLVAFDAHSAIHLDVAAAHIRGLVGGQKDDHVHHFLDGAHAPARLNGVEGAAGARYLWSRDSKQRAFATSYEFRLKVDAARVLNLAAVVASRNPGAASHRSAADTEIRIAGHEHVRSVE